MTKESSHQSNLAHIHSGTLSSLSAKMNVRTLEKALLRLFPEEDALAWDRTGLLVGDPTALITGVAVALDPTVEAILQAQAAGANVLLTHHPAFIEPPDSFMPGASQAESPGAVVWAAIKSGIALVNIHTALDVSNEAAQVLPGLLKLDFVGILDPIDEQETKGYGQICEVGETSGALSLGQLAARCTSVFGRHPRVWGDFNARVYRVVTCTGSASGLHAKSLAVHADVLVCGEVRYHDALEASEAGLAIIDLGHDVSELPLVATLISALERVGVSQETIIVLDQSLRWNSPETTRL